MPNEFEHNTNEGKVKEKKKKRKKKREGEKKAMNALLVYYGQFDERGSFGGNV